MFRRGEQTEETILQEIMERLRVLEEIATRRVLPMGYEFTYNIGTGELLVRRLSDGSTVSLIP